MRIILDQVSSCECASNHNTATCVTYRECSVAAGLELLPLLEKVHHTAADKNGRLRSAWLNHFTVIYRSPRTCPKPSPKKNAPLVVAASRRSRMRKRSGFNRRPRIGIWSMILTASNEPFASAIFRRHLVLFET